MDALLTIFFLYLVIGFTVAIFILTRKQFEKKDRSFRGTGIGFKLIILPGMLVFWPFLMYNLYLKKHL